jgi:hypothetical protein
MHLSFENLVIIRALGYKHFLWTSITTHFKNISWKMTPFLDHLKLAFALVYVRGRGYG